MSVYKSKRSTSAIQYVENARQLQVFTIKNCVKFPKRYTYIVVQKIANLVEDIDTHVRVAESMMPTNLHEAQLKRDELTYTFGLLNSLDDKLQLMYDIVSDNPNFKTEFKWLPNAMLEWGRLIQKERDLITGVKKADRKRFKEKFKEYDFDLLCSVGFWAAVVAPLTTGGSVLLILATAIISVMSTATATPTITTPTTVMASLSDSVGL